GTETVTQTVTVTVGATNDAPVAQDDSATTDEDAAVTIPVLANDSDADGDSLSIATATEPANGAVTINPNGTITYTPDANFNGTDTFDYTVTDGDLTDTATVTVTANPVADPAVITGVSTGAVTEDSVLEATGALLVDDPDAGEAAFIAQAGTAGTFGTFSLTASGNWTYSLNNTAANVQALNTGDTETDTFTATTVDGTTQTITLTINGVDEGATGIAPVANDVDFGTIERGTDLTIETFDIVSELASDSDSDLAAADIVFTDATVDGLAVSFAVIGFTYTPGAGDEAQLTVFTEALDPDGPLALALADDTAELILSFTATDSSGLSDTGTVTVTLVPDDGFSNVFDPAALGGDGVNLLVEFASSDPNATAVANVTSAADGPVEAEAAFVGNTSLRTFFAGFADDVFEAPANNPDQISLATAEAENASTATATASDGSATVAAASENSTAVATASKDSTANTAATVNSTANATASGDSDVVATAATNSESSATADGGSDAVSIVSENSTATADASDNSEASATAINTSTSAATATAQSGATAVAIDNSTATAESDEASSTAATSSDGSTTIAAASENSTAVATASEESFANAAANVGSTANATASNDGDSLATSVTDSESSATATNGGVAASISSNGSSATASASDGSDANATADIRSTSAATATVQSDATAIAVDNSDATAESDQASSTAATASKGSEAVATANDENTAVATSRDVSGVAGQPIDLTGLIDVDADGLAGEVQGITISGLPVGSEIAGETADADSTVTLSGALPDTLTLTVPASFEGSFELTLRALLPPDAEPNSKIAEAIATQTVTIFASSGGTNVAPIVSAIDGGTIGEGDAAIVLDLLDPDVVSDPDGDTLSAEILSVTDDTGAAVGAIFDGRSLTLDPFQFRFLDEGESRTVTVRYDVSDSEASVENIATLVITGADDQAVIIPTDALDDTIPVFNEIAYQASTSAFFATPPTVTGVAGGGFVVAWMGSDGDGTGIFAQVFDRFGDTFGPEILVNPNTENSPLDPHVEPLPFGGFAVAWDQGVTGDEDVAARLFDAKGVPLSGELRYENEFSGGNNFFDIEYLSTGGIAIVLPVREGQSQFSVTDVRLNGINSFGTEFGGFFRDSPLVNNERFGDQRGGVVSDLGNSTFVVVWVSNPGSGQSIEENEGIFGVKARIFSDAFDPIGEEFQVTELPRQFGIDAVLDVATLSDGDFVITWAGVTPLDGSEAGILARRYAPDGMPRGEAFLVNQETLSDQDDPQIAALPNGGYAITFISNGLTGDDSGTSIQARVFDANDAPVTDEFRVNTDVLFSQRKPGIAALEDGAFVVTWEDVGAFNAAIFEGDGTPRSQSGASANGVYTFSADLLTNNDVIEFDRDTSSTSIQARFFSENGAAAAREFRVNSEFNGFQTDPDITQLADGRIVIVWESPDLVDDPSETGVKAQIFEADGTPVGEEFLINTVFANSQSDPKVTALEDGGFLVVYTSTDRGEGELFSRIKAQLFEADGTRRGEEFNIDDFGGRTPGLTDVVTLEKGGFAALWQDTTPDDLGTEDVNESRTIYLLRFFGADGQPVGDAIEIDPDSPGAFQATAITKLEDGNVLVTWSDVTASDDDTFSREEARIVGRVYAPDGSVVAADFTASNAGDIINDGQSAAALGDGGFVVAWRAFTVVGDTTEARLAARIYGADNQPVGDEFVLTTLANVFFTDVQISATADGGFVATYRVDTGDDFLAPEYVAEFFNADGTSKGDPVPLHSQEVGFETSVRAVGLESGNVVFVWASDVEALNTEPLTIIDVSDNSALGAVVTLNEDGTVSYDATGVAEAQALAPGETLTDSFTYTAQNGSGGTDTASVTITVFGENAQPVAPPIDAGTVTEEDGDVLIDLLDGAFDPEGETVTAELIRVTSEFGIDVPFRLVDEDTIAIDPERYAALDDSESLTLTVDFQVSDGVHSVANTATLVIEGTDDELAAVNDRIEPTPEWVVNLATQSSQFDPRAIATDDGFVIAWESFDRTIDRDRLGLKAIVFEEDGSFNPSRGEFLVNRFTAGDQRNIDMAILNDGNILYVWETTTGSQGDTSSSAIKAIVRDGQGNFNLGDEFLVNEFTDGAQRAPSVALLPDGGYVIVWESAEPGQGDESRSGIKARLFDADGTPRTLPGSTVSEFLVNERTESFQESPNITLLADGRFVVVWAGRARLDEDVDGAPIIAGRIFNPDGTPASAGGSEFQISETEFLQTEFGDAETPDVEALPDGGFVVVWESTENRDAEIKARFYDSSGIPAGDAFVVNESGSGLQTQPSIDVLEDGGVVIVWRSEAIDRAEDPDGTSIRGRVFNADGTPRILPGEESAEFVVNIIAETDQSDPDVAALADGGFIVTWSSRDDEQTDKSFGGVKARVFNADGTTRDVGGAGETNFLRIPVDQILQNDFSGNTNLQITRVSGSELGAFVSLNTTSGEISYDPRNLDVVKALALGEVIEDRFTYTVTDSSLETDTATVTIVIRGSDDGNASASVVLMGAPTLLKDKPAAPEDMLEAAIQGDSLVLDAFQASEPLERAAPPIQEGHDDPLIETAASSALVQVERSIHSWSIS
ncbi:MAG: VCBS domain-containing protein, partial [Pseudomonadota bacterium]